MISDRAQNLHESCTLIEDNLPEGWIEITLDQILQALESGSRPKGGVRGIAEGIPSIGGEHIDENGGFRFETIKFVPHNFFKQMNHGHIQTGDILIVKDGATTGKVALVRDDFPYNPAVVNEHVFICRPAEGIHPPFVFHFLFSKEGQDRILENFRGSAQGGINQSFAPGTSVPLAPLAEQKRIMAKVGELLERVNAIKERLAKVLTILKRFRQSVLTAACSGRFTADWRDQDTHIKSAAELLYNIVEAHEKAGGHKRGNAAPPSEDVHDLSKEDLPISWELTEMRNLVEPDRPITYGILKPGPDIDDGVPYVRVVDFPSDNLNLSTIRRTSKKIEATYSRARLREGDILLSIRGTVGRVCIVPRELHNANITQDSARLTIQRLMNAHFIAWILRAPSTQNRMQRAIKGAAIRGINIGDVRALQVPIPPLEEQDKIVRRVEALFGLADVIEKRVAVATARADKLTQAILTKAFRGELVPTEAELARRERRSYEPASDLLARIKSERESKQASQKVRRNRN